jgi:signal transduction histidine kinase
MDTTALSRPSTQSVWLTVFRVFQVFVICLTVGLFFTSIPLNYEQRSQVCLEEPCSPDQLAPASVGALQASGMTVDSFVQATIALDILIAVTYTICAVVILVRKPNEILTIFVTIMLVTFGMATFTGGTRGIAVAFPKLGWLTQTIELIGSISIIAFFFVFPNGRFVPRWSAAILIGWFLFQLPRYYFPNSPLNLRHDSTIYNLLFSLGLLSGIVAQIYRYIRVSNAIERQQTKWVLYGLTIGMGGYIIVRLLSLRVSDPLGSNLFVSLGLNLAAILLMLLIPISISIAVIRFRLWDINPIINRTLVYGALTASTIALYIVAVGFFSNYFQNSRVNFIVSFIATGAVAILFEPLRERLQRAVNRLMYGERDDPATVLTHLSQRLDSALAPASVLQTIVETLAQTLRLPYTAISIFPADVDKEPRAIAETGTHPSEVIPLPLSYQSERVGELILAPRATGESFSPADMKLLNIIAGQAGIAVHNLRLTQDLQRSREKLVTAQEEERRRLRRDLHDGVGPTLASLTQRIDNASDLVKSDPEKSIQMLRELKGQVKGTVAEIRRLVYALRPPVLDEFGLVSALREHVAQYAGPSGMDITFDVTDPMPPLPAAVEVAAYRILTEAFTNIVQHAQASRCNIKIQVNGDSLSLEITDDGKGLTTKTHTGVGLLSMRERAAELGGETLVENIPSGGTRVLARLPIGKE